MTNPFQENVNQRIMRKKKIPQDAHYKITKFIKLSAVRYNVMHEHNYFRDLKKKRCRWPELLNEKEYLNDDEMIKNEHDEPIPDWLMVKSSSDEEDDINVNEDKPLSQIIQLEHQKYLLYEYKNRKCTDLLPFDDNEIYNELNIANNHDLSNMSNDSNNIIIESSIVNDTTILQNQNITNDTDFQIESLSQPCQTLIVKNNFMCNELSSNDLSNKKARKKSYNDDLQNDLMYSSLDLNNALFVKRKHFLHDNAIFTKKVSKHACPPLQWIHLIYLAIKNSTAENVTCYDIQRIVRYWFPYYCRRSYIKFIRIILGHINRFCQKYFYCNSFPFTIDYDDTWTINSKYAKTLEESLLRIVENNENEIKSAMNYPDKLPTILNGYGVLYLGCGQNSRVTEY